MPVVLGITSGLPTNRPEHIESVHVEPFMEDHMVPIVPASHDWADHEASVSILKSTPLLMKEFGFGSRRVVENALTEAGINKKELNNRMELDSAEGARQRRRSRAGRRLRFPLGVRNQFALETLKLARMRGLKLYLMLSIVYPTGAEPAGNAGVLRMLLLARGMHIVLRATGKVTTYPVSHDLSVFHMFVAGVVVAIRLTVPP
jgi:LysR family transcriptional regulator, transcriptional activator of the cysJI operon